MLIHRDACVCVSVERGGGEDGWDSCVPVQPEGVLSALLAMQMHEEGLSPSDLP